MKNKIIYMSLLIASLMSCKTIDLEEASKTPTEIVEDKESSTNTNTKQKLNEENKITDTSIKTGEDEQVELLDSKEDVETAESIEKQYIIQDMENTIVYIERPVYIPTESTECDKEVKRVTGYEASVASEKKSVIKPENYKYGTFIYQFNTDMVYEIYAEPYHLTDIMLEPGEVVIGTPLLSEDESVWELTAGVGKDTATGLDVQHLFIKPAYSRLDSTLVIITDRREMLPEPSPLYQTKPLPRKWQQTYSRHCKVLQPVFRLYPVQVSLVNLLLSKFVVPLLSLLKVLLLYTL